MSAPIDTILIAAADRLDAGRAIALCLITSARGSTPASPGSLMLVDDAGSTFGTIGGGCVEAEVRRRVLAMISDRATGLLSFQLNHDFGWDDGLICGGSINVAVALPIDSATLRHAASEHRARRPVTLSFDVELQNGPHRFLLEIPPRPRLLIAGAGHVGSALVGLALTLDFDVTVFDDRADALERAAEPPALGIPGPIAANLAAQTIDDETYIVIVTRGHRHDEEVLMAVVNRPARYLGMIGSRRKVKLIFDDLRETGITDQVLAKVHAPIGLDIDAVTVPEIALSIAAQLVATRRENYRNPVRSPIPISESLPSIHTTAQSTSPSLAAGS